MIIYLNIYFKWLKYIKIINKMNKMNKMNKIALITGSSRGIGRSIALGLANKGYNIVLAAKSVRESDNLPGTIYSVAEEIEKIGVKALPIKTDLRKIEDIKNLTNNINKEFGKLDVLVNNAGALWWKPVEDTPIEKYDLINDINVRASYALSRECIPLMKCNGGHIIMHSPPLPDTVSDYVNNLNGKVGYMISKWGMTMTALGLSRELADYDIACNTIWPMTAIKSSVTRNYKLGNETLWRKDKIIVDCIEKIVDEDKQIFTGLQLIDELYLRSKGIEDFSEYQCVSGFEPPKLTSLNHLFKT